MVMAFAMAGVALQLAHAQPRNAGFTRTGIARGLLGDGHEIIQVRVDFATGAAFPRHSHPGVEVAYVLEGSIAYQFDGQPPVTLATGASLFIPAETLHSARSVGSGKASELATYVVERDKPLVEVPPSQDARNADMK